MMVSKDIPSAPARRARAPAPRDPPSPSSLLDEGEDAVEETAAEEGGGAQAGDLFGVLDLRRFGDQRVYSDEEGAAQLCGTGLAHAVQGGDGGRVSSKPQRLTAAAAIHSQASVSGGLVGSPLRCPRLGIGLGRCTPSVKSTARIGEPTAAPDDPLRRAAQRTNSTR